MFLDQCILSVRGARSVQWTYDIRKILPFNSLVWGSLTLAPIIAGFFFAMLSALSGFTKVKLM